MTYQEMRERLELLERKIEEQGASEAVLLSIDDGIDTRRLLMKRKTLYDMIYPIIEEEQPAANRRWPDVSYEEEQALLRAVAWAQARCDMPDSVNRLLRAYYEAAPAHYPLARIENCLNDPVVSQAEDAMAAYHLRTCLNDWKQQIQAQEEDEWERS